MYPTGPLLTEIWFCFWCLLLHISYNKWPCAFIVLYFSTVPMEWIPKSVLLNQRIKDVLFLETIHSLRNGYIILHLYHKCMSMHWHLNIMQIWGIFVNLSILLIKQLPFIVLQAWSYDPRGPEVLSPLASPAQGSRGVPRADCSTPPTGAELRPAPILAQVQGTLDNQYNPSFCPGGMLGFVLFLRCSTQSFYLTC